MLKMHFSLMIHLMSPIKFFVKLQGRGSLSLLHSVRENVTAQCQLDVSHPSLLKPQKLQKN